MTNRYEILSKGERAELRIYGDIGQDWFADESNDASSITDKLDDLKGDLTVRINSYGGSVADGLAIFNALRRREGRVTTHIDGVAYSIASLIAMAGDEINIAGNAMVMVHAPWGGAVGNAGEMREMADILDKHAEAMIDSYVRNGNPAEATVRAWLTDGEDHYFTASEAIEAGLADVIEEPVEISDIAAGLRTDKRYKRFPAAGRRITTNLEATMPETKTQGAPGGASDDNYTDITAQHSATVKAARSAGAKGEAKRRDTVRDVFAGFYTGDPLDPITAVYQACMDDVNCGELDANRQLLASLGQRSADPIISPMQYGMEQTYQAPPNASRHLGGAPIISRDQQDKRADGITKALEIRAGLITDPKVHDQERNNEFLAMSLTELISRELRASGYQVGGDRNQIARQYVQALPVLAAGTSHGSDHLANILSDVANKSALMGWEQAEETWSQWTVPGTLNDYRAAERANLALLDKLDKMREHQEWEYGDLADVKQSITGFFYGKKYGFSIQAIVNDDLNELTRAFGAWGEAASATVGDAVLALLTTAGTGGFGQSMDEDSTVVFHANHSNYVASGSGAAPSETTLNAGYVAMSTQTDQNARTLGVRPRYILHGATLASTVYRQLNSELMITGAASTVPDANWVRSLGLQPVQDYRLDGVFSGLGWYLAAARRTIEVSGVAGPLSPRVERSTTSQTPGIEYEMFMPFGCAALDYRGLYFNYGQ